MDERIELMSMIGRNVRRLKSDAERACRDLMAACVQADIVADHVAPWTHELSIDDLKTLSSRYKAAAAAALSAKVIAQGAASDSMAAYAVAVDRVDALAKLEASKAPPCPRTSEES